jgi:hypothetical protein
VSQLWVLTWASCGVSSQSRFLAAVFGRRHLIIFLLAFILALFLMSILDLIGLRRCLHRRDPSEFRWSLYSRVIGMDIVARHMVTHSTYTTRIAYIEQKRRNIRACHSLREVRATNRISSQSAFQSPESRWYKRAGLHVLHCGWCPHSLCS